MVTPHQVVNGRSRQRRGSYQDSIERRAAIAVAMMRENGWSVKHTSGLFCVNRCYLDVARHLDTNGLYKLATGELRLAQLYKEYQQRLAERREQRRQAEWAAEQQAEHEEQTCVVHDCLDRVSLTRFLEQAVVRYGGADVLEELDVLFQRQGSNIVDLIISTHGAERVLRSLNSVMASMGAMVAE
jgi:hypothetical protein